MKLFNKKDEKKTTHNFGLPDEIAKKVDDHPLKKGDDGFNLAACKIVDEMAGGEMNPDPDTPEGHIFTYAGLKGMTGLYTPPYKLQRCECGGKLHVAVFPFFWGQLGVLACSECYKVKKGLTPREDFRREFREFSE